MSNILWNVATFHLLVMQYSTSVLIMLIVYYINKLDNHVFIVRYHWYFLDIIPSIISGVQIQLGSLWNNFFFIGATESRMI